MKIIYFTIVALFLFKCVSRPKGQPPQKPFTVKFDCCFTNDSVVINYNQRVIFNDLINTDFPGNVKNVGPVIFISKSNPGVLQVNVGGQSASLNLKPSMNGKFGKIFFVQDSIYFRIDSTLFLSN